MAKQKTISLEPLKYTNSAGRLFRFMTAREGDSSLAYYFAAVLYPNFAAYADVKKRKAGIKAIAKAQEMYEEFVSDLQSAEMLEAQRALLLHGLSGLGAIFYPENISAATRAMSEAERSLLELSATFLPMEGQIEQEDVEKIRASIEELRVQLDRGDLNPTLRKMLQELVRIGTGCIDRANIEGVRGL